MDGMASVGYQHDVCSLDAVDMQTSGWSLALLSLAKTPEQTVVSRETSALIFCRKTKQKQRSEPCQQTRAESGASLDPGSGGSTLPQRSTQIPTWPTQCELASRTVFLAAQRCMIIALQ